MESFVELLLPDSGFTGTMASTGVSLVVTNTCFRLLLDEVDAAVGLLEVDTMTVGAAGGLAVGVPAIGVALGACKTRITLEDETGLALLKMAAVGRLVVFAVVVTIVGDGEVSAVKGVIMTPDLVAETLDFFPGAANAGDGDGSVLASGVDEGDGDDEVVGGSGMRPLKLAKISATFLLSD